MFILLLFCLYAQHPDVFLVVTPFFNKLLTTIAKNKKKLSAYCYYWCCAILTSHLHSCGRNQNRRYMQYIGLDMIKMINNISI
jgi:hypothetical protein